ncbi:type 1 fimbrial protein [Rahnella aceris]|uniref:fimbrial protein n=1 Tax=Rahnella sp. (strain Y9602) TaxID=2703885 RepID=UPI001C260826|nr:fimbrial protein [Rahnella aceris]MBU9839256.1 type 1 fimbrial protein [Rahnella aceris]
MNKKKLSLTMLSVVSCLYAASGYAATDTQSGIMHISTHIDQNTCAWNTAASGLTQSVSLPDIPLNELASLNPWETIENKEVQFSVTDCPETIKTVKLKFSYSSQSGVPAALMKNNGTAKGVEFVMYDDESKIGGNTSTVPIQPNGIVSAPMDDSGAATINIYPTLIRDKFVAAEGTVQSSADISVIYE